MASDPALVYEKALKVYNPTLNVSYGKGFQRRLSKVKDQDSLEKLFLKLPSVLPNEKLI